MREGWRKVHLGQVCTLQRGFDLPASARRPGAIPVVSSGGISGSHDEPMCKAPGVVMGRYGTIGEVHFVNADHWPLNTTLWVADFQGNLPEYVFRVLQAIDYRAFSDKTGVPGVNRNDLHRIPVLLAPRDEQRRIAEILGTWDEAIETTERLIAAKERRLDWFRVYVVGGRTRLPGFSEKWESVRLSAVLREHGENSTGAEPVYSVSVHRGLVDQIEHLGRSFAAANTDHYNRVLPGDIVYTKSPTGDFPWGIIKQSAASRPVIVSPLYGVFTPATRALGALLDLHFTSPVATTNYLAPLVQKGAKNTISITNGRFLEGKLLLPLDPGEQSAIASIIDCARTEVELLRRQRDALVKQKRGLMQKLLTGEWPVIADGAEEAAA